MKASMIASVRESAGLGSPPVPYTTNRNESMNNVAKAYTDYHQSNWVQLADNMFELVNTQSKEVEKAVFAMGEYRFKPAYKSLDVESSKWFMMSSDQRQKHLKKVWSMQSTSFEADAVASGGDKLKCLSIPPDRSGITTLSSELLERTWNKAEKLLNTAGSICGAPGMQDAMCVASESGSKPHIVCRNKKGSYTCDEACLACPEEKKCLEEFLIGYKRSKTTGNYTAVSTHNQPKSVGKKPGGTKRKGPSQYKKPEIEAYIDPFNEEGNSDPSQVSVTPPHSNPLHTLPAYSTASVSSRQISQLNVSRSHPFSAHSTVGTSNQVGQQSTSSQSRPCLLFRLIPQRQFQVPVRTHHLMCNLMLYLFTLGFQVLRSAS